MKRIEGAAALAAGVVAVSLVLAGCARDEARSTTVARVPPPAATADATAAQVKTVTLNVKGMT